MGLILLKPTINYAKEYLSYLKPVNDEAGRLLIARTTFLGKSACCLLKFTVSYNGYHHHTMGIFCAGFTPPSSSLLPPPGFNPKMKRYRKNVRWPTEPGKTEQRTKMIKPRKTKQNKNEKYNRRPGQNMDRFQRVQIEKLMCRWTTQCSYRSLFIRSMPSTSPEGVFSLSLNFRRRLQKPIICY